MSERFHNQFGQIINRDLAYEAANAENNARDSVVPLNEETLRQGLKEQVDQYYSERLDFVRGFIAAKQGKYID